MTKEKCFEPTWKSCGTTHALLACQHFLLFISSLVILCHTLNTTSVAGRMKKIIKLSVAGRIKKIIKIKKHELYEKSGMEGIFMHGDWRLKK